MNRSTLFAAALIVTAASLVPTLSEARGYHRHHGHHRLPYSISYLHNYGPGPLPGTFALYDGPTSNYCYQGSAAYRGQDGRRHPCF